MLTFLSGIGNWAWGIGNRAWGMGHGALVLHPLNPLQNPLPNLLPSLEI
ncbi:hypothetical protein [Tychonema bourrellyi]|nr:hypothetical protein [Tychonema bourrellyi]